MKRLGTLISSMLLRSSSGGDPAALGAIQLRPAPALHPRGKHHLVGADGARHFFLKVLGRAITCLTRLRSPLDDQRVTIGWGA